MVLFAGDLDGASRGKDTVRDVGGLVEGLDPAASTSAVAELVGGGAGRSARPQPPALAAAVAALLAVPAVQPRAAARTRAESFPWSRTPNTMLALHGLAHSIRSGGMPSVHPLTNYAGPSEDQRHALVPDVRRCVGTSAGVTSCGATVTPTHGNRPGWAPAGRMPKQGCEVSSDLAQAIL